MVSDIEWIKRMLSHNVRMPMSVIAGYGELLRQGLLSAEEQKEVIENICENIDYMSDVLKVVLDDTAQEHPAEKVDVAEMLFRTKKFVDEVARKVPVTISVKTEKPQMYVDAKVISLMRIFYHLFENSLKYLHPFGEIMINVYSAGEENVLVVFKDSGIGMSEKEVKHIFEKGFRGSNSRGKTGSGFGLYEVKKLMEENGGTVEISSREDVGFSVYLMFPAYRDME